MPQSIKLKETEESNPSPAKEPSQPVNTTANLVAKLLNPEVRISETREYKRYVCQFKQSQIALTPTSSIDAVDFFEELPDHPDFDFFTKYTQSNLDYTAHIPKDEQIYKNFVLSGVTEVYVGIGSKSNDISRFEGYHHWFETGVYIQPGIKQRNSRKNGQ